MNTLCILPFFNLTCSVLDVLVHTMTYTLNVGLGNISMQNHDMRQDIITDFWYCYIVIWCVLSLSLQDCSHCSFLPLATYPHYWSLLVQNVIGLIFCEITSSRPYNIALVSRCLVRNFVIFILAAPTTYSAQQVVSPTWSVIIDIDQYETSLSW